MLKFLFLILFIIPLSFLKNSFWMVQNILFIIIFLLILYLPYSGHFMYISYFLGEDLISYGLIFLSV